MNDLNQMRQASGIRFLENETASADCKGLKTSISGLELPVQTYRKFRKSAVTPDAIAECLGQQPDPSEGSFSILLAHNPAYMDAYLGWGADLILSGHLHGGLVRIPGLGGIMTPQGFPVPEIFRRNDPGRRPECYCQQRPGHPYA